MNYHAQLLPVDCCETLILAVPVFRVTELVGYAHIFTFLICLFSIFVLISFCAKKVFRSSSEFWSVLNTGELLIGTSVEEQPSTSTQKIFFMCFALISMKYSTDLYSDIVGITSITYTMPFDTLEAVENSRLPIYADHHTTSYV